MFFHSTRFGCPAHEKAKEVHSILTDHGIDSFLCNVERGGDITSTVEVALDDATYLVSYVDDNVEKPYGEDTGRAVVVTYYELKQFHERRKRIIPLKLYSGDPWPPQTMKEKCKGAGPETVARYKASQTQLNAVFLPGKDYMCEETWDANRVAQKLMEMMVMDESKKEGLILPIGQDAYTRFALPWPKIAGTWYNKEMGTLAKIDVNFQAVAAHFQQNGLHMCTTRGHLVRWLHLGYDRHQLCSHREYLRQEWRSHHLCHAKSRS